MCESTNHAHEITPDCQKLNSWGKIIYEEAWRQYRHEDSLSHSRTTTYFSVQSAVFVLIAALSPAIINASRIEDSFDFRLLCILFGMLLFLMGLLSCVGSRSWKHITLAGVWWRERRLETAKKLEDRLELTDFGLASAELEWTDKPAIGGTKAILMIVTFFEIMSFMLMLTGLILLIVAAIK